VLNKGDKEIRVNLDKILTIKSSNVIVASGDDYEYEYRKAKSTSAMLLNVAKIKSVRIVPPELLLDISIFDSYADSITGARYSKEEARNLYKTGYYRIYSIYKDTSLAFKINEVSRITLQTKAPKQSDGMGILFTGLIGSAGVIGSIIEIIKGHNAGFLSLGLSGILLGNTINHIKKAQYFKRYDINSKKWKIMPL
jgi:hypothetical protein